MTTSRTWPVWLVCLLAAMIEGFDIQSMGVAAPRMLPALHLTPGQAGWAFSASLIGLMVGASFGGVIADRTGRRPVLTASVAAFGVFSLVTALATGFAPLLAVRFLTGLGLGGAMPMLIALASEQASAARKATMVALIAGGMPLGGAMAGLVARTPMALDDWRTIFLVGGLAPLVIAPLLYLVLPVGRPDRAARQGGEASRALFGTGRWPATACLWVSYALVALTPERWFRWWSWRARWPGCSLSNVRRPGRWAQTSTAMLPGRCWLASIFSWAAGMSSQGKTSDRQGSTRRSMTSWLAALACIRLAKWLPWTRFWRIHRKRASMVRLKPLVPAQMATMPPRLTTNTETGKVDSPGARTPGRRPCCR
jgi:MFS family permease